MLERANAATDLKIAAQGDGFGPSDHSSFYAKNIPVLHFFTDLHDDYHRACDIAGEDQRRGRSARRRRSPSASCASIADRAGAPRRTCASRRRSQTELARRHRTSTSARSPTWRAATRRGSSSPAFAPEVRRTSRGIKAGDVIVEFAGKPVKDLYQYSDALYAHKPGDEVTVVVLRDGQRVSLKVKLGKRGG